MVGLGGLEPPTSPLSGVRSSHLSYRPNTYNHIVKHHSGLPRKGSSKVRRANEDQFLLQATEPPTFPI
jgi:hypothetical protein